MTKRMTFTPFNILLKTETESYSPTEINRGTNLLYFTKSGGNRMLFVYYLLSLVVLLK